LLEFRSPVILAAVPVGLALACIGWFAFAGPARVLTPVQTAQGRLSALPSARASAGASTGGAVAAALSPALFGNAGAEIAVRLEGLSRTPRRSAALVSINGGPAGWLTAGATREGVTLVQVLSTKAVIDTIAGRRVITLGETSGAASTLAGGDDQPPPGVRMPPPPASAPGVR
jgi:hypothetical protein